jgi:hypothetical protein
MMNKAMTSSDFAAAFLEGVKINASPISGVNYEDLAFTLAKLLHDERTKIKSLKSQIEHMDEVANECLHHVKCRSCDEWYDLPCNLSDFHQDMSYCGGSPRCCP